jgi:hypothetical protein
MLGFCRFAVLSTVSIVMTLMILSCSSDDNTQPRPTAASTTPAATSGRAVPTLAPDSPSSPPSPPPADESTPIPTATLTPSFPDSPTVVVEATVRVPPAPPPSQPIAQPTPRPIATPRPVVRAGASITSVTSPVSRGSTAVVTATAGPGDSCSIRVTVPGGVTASANGLGAKLADGSGKVSWSWVVGPATPLGTGRVAVKCGQREEASIALIIAR